MRSLEGVWWYSNTFSMASTFPMVKKSSSWKASPVHSHGIIRNKYYSVMTKQMNFNCPHHWNQWKHWPKWQQLGAKCNYCLHFQPEMKRTNFKNSSLVIVNSFPSSVFPSEASEETDKKNHFLCCRRFHSLLVHSGTQKCVGRVKQNRLNPQWSTFFALLETDRIFWSI